MIWKILFAAFFLIGASADNEGTSAENKVVIDEKEVVTEENEDVTDKNESWRDITEKCFNSPGSLYFRGPIPLQYFMCVQTVFKINDVEKLIKETRENGTAHELVKNFCSKSQELKSCISNTTTQLVPCMKKDLTNQINAPYKELVDFVCYNEGERMSLFINEGGVSCFEEKVDSILGCMGVRASNIDVLEFMVLSVAAQCTRYDVIAPCVVKGLKECSSPVPGDLAHALFENIRQYIVCQKQKN